MLNAVEIERHLHQATAFRMKTAIPSLGAYAVWFHEQMPYDATLGHSLILTFDDEGCTASEMFMYNITCNRVFSQNMYSLSTARHVKLSRAMYTVEVQKIVGHDDVASPTREVYDYFHFVALGWLNTGPEQADLLEEEQVWIFTPPSGETNEMAQYLGSHFGADGQRHPHNVWTLTPVDRVDPVQVAALEEMYPGAVAEVSTIFHLQGIFT